MGSMNGTSLSMSRCDICIVLLLTSALYAYFIKMKRLKLKLKLSFGYDTVGVERVSYLMGSVPIKNVVTSTFYKYSVDFY